METQLNLNLKPRAGSVLTHGWNILWDKFITLFLILLVIWVSYIPISVMESTDPTSFGATVLGAFSLLYLIFIIAPFKVSADYMYLKAIRRQPLDVKELFDVFNNYLNVVLASLLKFAIIGIGFAFLIIPGIIFACRLVFVPYLVMDKRLDPVKAVEESWRLTQGYGWRIFWMGIVSFFLVIGGFMVFLFGSVIAFMWVNAAFAGLYHAVLMERGEYFESKIEEDGIITNEARVKKVDDSKKDAENDELNDSENN
ncbi:MAG: hypothetical protein PF517_07395 [Salinivirgaceae bacterium]|jgi:uncharacterized membrane protein|nr:hypothetical protein [Salinivirgaceae bacterium]